LALGTTVGSVVDVDTKPSEVYAVDLVAGQTMLVTVSAPNGLRSLELYNPGTASILSADSGDFADDWSVGDSLTAQFVPAVSGVYYLRVRADNQGQPYELQVRATS
jgi:hypothetical protein